MSRINSPGNPARLSLPADWRVLGFGLALTLGGDGSVRHRAGVARLGGQTGERAKGRRRPHARRRLMHALIAVQAAFCILVLFVRRPVRDHFSSADASASRNFRRTASRSRYRLAARPAAGPLGAGDRTPADDRYRCRDGCPGRRGPAERVRHAKPYLSRWRGRLTKMLPGSWISPPAGWRP